MRLTSLFLSFWLLLPVTTQAGGFTAQDLANHFQIEAWASTVTLLPGNYSLSLCEVTDGKVSENPVVRIAEISASAAGSETDEVKFVVMFSKPSVGELAAGGRLDEEHRLKYSFFVGQTGAFGYCHELPLRRNRSELPDGITEGEYVLAGERRDGVSSSPDFHVRSSDLSHGIILRIQKVRGFQP